MKLFKIFILSMLLEQVIFLADYYTDLVSSFRFVVIKEILGGGGGGVTSDRLSGRILFP